MKYNLISISTDSENTKQNSTPFPKTAAHYLQWGQIVQEVN